MSGMRRVTIPMSTSIGMDMAIDRALELGYVDDVKRLEEFK